MSHLRAPAARADRREGGRHGRPVSRPAPAPAETHIRPQLLRLAVLPPTAVALSACAAVLFTVRSTGARPGPVLWAVLAGAVAVTGVGIVVAAVAADRAARSVSDRVTALRRNSARGEADLRALLDTLRRGEPPPQRTPRGGPTGDADEFELLAADLSRAHDGAATAVVQAAQLSSQTGSEQKLEVFVNLARRLQSLVHREIATLDELENEIEDPDLLKGLFHVDHLATRIRRHAENLAVLGGAVSRRQWSNPVSMTEVLRSAIAEVEQYSRVKLVPPVDGELRGHAVADVIHLLAELVENATVFSAPHTQVLLRANLVTSGLAVEVEDRGLGMPVEEQSRMNALLADPDQVNVGRLLADGRIGLYVVSQLARRHGIRVRLQNNIYGGVQAVLVVPQALLGSAGLPLPQAEERGAGMLPTGATGATGPAGGQGARDGGRPQPAPHARVQAQGQARPESRPQPQPQLQSPAPLQPQAPSPTHLQPRLQPQLQSQLQSPASPVPTPYTPPRLAPHAGAASAPTTGSPVQHDTPRPNDGRPAPLPVRGAHEERPNPAEAVPGVRPGDRSAVEEIAGLMPTPRAGAVRGTMGKPQLPRRRAHEHLAPQLRGGPAPRPDAAEQPAGHDPGLMAAFQRGVGLAEAQQSLEADPLPDPAVADSTPAMPAYPMTEARTVYGLSGDLDHQSTTRHDGSTPAG
ncbi:ATP-binding protein [Streptomyces phaeoluteigriseus]|uniref:histidine kinase n=1 Tax=Streptomyces phaeoluteigriseus TaxID=114686 RepID=A0ABY4Z6H7_9ACTN|nr:ATP-binding protein [Streptomyces phaeoluteigriseus]USQ84586.1 ATP-binding protein [Streptomyces phaeoluteigriseus]